MLDLLQLVTTKKKRASNGWYNFNAVCCHHRGHRPDKRMRGGILSDGRKQTYHCFNCGYVAKFEIGRPLNKKTKQLLKWLGLDDNEINKWNIESLKRKNILDLLSEPHKKTITFKNIKLPNNAILLDNNNPEYQMFRGYLKRRGFTPEDYTFYITPNDPIPRNRFRIIIPMKYKTNTIGYISRFIDGKTPKYIKENQPGAIFGYDLQKPDYEVALVFEGVFDALAFNGIALLHDDISDYQALLLKNLNRKIIVVPDQDKTGMKIIERALDLGFHVSIPNWGKGIKDANDAMLKYGRIPTLLSILQNATNNKILIRMKGAKIA
jgi:hypothetical protein